MIALTSKEAGRAIGLSSFREGVSGLSIDTRSLVPGDLFVAIAGECFDGHDFVWEALAKGASGCVVEGGRWPRTANGEQREAAVYVVDDTRAALGSLAREVRRKSEATVLAITGSVGKTSTKDMLGAMVARVGPVTVTQANKNNELGVPLTLLSMTPGTRSAVIEMGMRGLGQIGRLAKIAEPDVGLVTNVHPVHLELLGDLECVARAKAELVQALPEGGVAVIPLDCLQRSAFRPRGAQKVVTFGLAELCEGADVIGWQEPRRNGSSADCSGSVLAVRWPGGEAQLNVPFSSRYGIENAVAATAACYAGGFPVEECFDGLAGVRLSGGRGDLQRVGGLHLINDTYNANPAAVRAALDELMAVAGRLGCRAVAVLGDMLELGSEEERYHEEVGRYAARLGVGALWGVGPLSRATVRGYEGGQERSRSGLAGASGGCHLQSVDEVDSIIESLRVNDVVLFKGSRSMKLELMLGRIEELARLGTWGEGRQ